jgi:hypothetical protein
VAGLDKALQGYATQIVAPCGEYPCMIAWTKKGTVFSHYHYKVCHLGNYEPRSKDSSHRVSPFPRSILEGDNVGVV